MALEEPVAPDYQACASGTGVASRPERRFLEVMGRAPGDMLNGILTGGMPKALVEDQGLLRGYAVYSAILTVKGRMISDLRILRGIQEGFLLDLPDLGLVDVKEWFKKYLPPRLARVEDRSSEFSALILLGPEGPASLEKAVTLAGDGTGGSEVGEGSRGLNEPGSVAGRMMELEEGEEAVFPATPFGLLRVAATGDLNCPAWELVLAAEHAGGLQSRLMDDRATKVSPETLDVLRIEKGRPAFGKDMDQETIPVEAGVSDRAIDHGKGCYTGQEVIIRIRDRGHANKKLHGLLLGDAPVPPAGRELFSPDKERAVGWITSACYSPALGETAALGYLRRGSGPGAEVRVGDPLGPPARVRALDDSGWILD